MKHYLRIIILLSVLSVCFLTISSVFARVEKQSTKSQVDLHSISQQLGWVDDTHAPNLCKGYYKEPLLNFHRIGLIAPNDTQVTADRGDLFQYGRSTLTGHVIVNQPNRQITADLAHIYRNKKTGKITRIDLFGNVHAREPGKLLIGRKAHLNLRQKTGEINHALYRVSFSDEKSVDHGISHLYGTNAWGQADKMIRKPNDNYFLQNASYTTCPPRTRAWRLTAKTITLDKKAGRGYAKKVKLYFKNFPPLYLPFFSFPINDRRKSGFLIPEPGYSDNAGASLMLPYYWNIAPNYDATFYPTIYSKRGIMLAGEFRYLQKKNHGRFFASFLPHDAKFAESHTRSQRGYFSWRNSTQFNKYWSSKIDYRFVSDDNYFQDFSSSLVESSQNQLLRYIDLNYNDDHWNILALAESYQTLHPTNQAAVSNVYSRLPQIGFSANYPMKHYLFTMQGEIDNFVWPESSDKRPDGYRAHLVPTIRVPVYTPSAFFIPSLQLDATYYQLEQQPVGFKKTFTRVLPIASVDMGLFFERNVHYLNSRYIQTLEPRLFYLYVPFYEQRQIPSFDSSYYIFRYGQLFRTNRFSGIDRVGDANQVSFALTSKFIDANTGIERVRASIGQTVYFQTRRTPLCYGLTCSDPETILGFLNPRNNFSPLVGEVNYKINPHWDTSTDIAWDHQSGYVQNGHFDFKYHSSDYQQIVTVGYAFLRNGDTNPTRSGAVNLNFNQLYISYAQPLNKHWSTLGTWGYNLSHQYPMTYYLGLQYKSCCWAFRILGGRTFSNLDTSSRPVFNTGISFELVLKGLGTLDANSTRKKIAQYLPDLRSY